VPRPAPKVGRLIKSRFVHPQAISNLSTGKMATSGTGKADKEAKRQRFLDVFPILAEELVGYVKSTGSPEEVWGWFERVS
jgi:hypothetical protein